MGGGFAFYGGEAKVQALEGNCIRGARDVQDLDADLERKHWVEVVGGRWLVETRVGSSWWLVGCRLWGQGSVVVGISRSLSSLQSRKPES